jgi:hypothetical protein
MSRKERIEGQMERDRLWPGKKEPLLITVEQARNLFRREEGVKAVVENMDGVYCVRVQTEEQTFRISTQNFSKIRDWYSREKAIAYVCKNFGLPDTTEVEVIFRKSEDKKNEAKRKD